MRTTIIHWIDGGGTRLDCEVKLTWNQGTPGTLGDQRGWEAQVRSVFAQDEETLEPRGDWPKGNLKLDDKTLDTIEQLAVDEAEGGR